VSAKSRTGQTAEIGGPLKAKIFPNPKVCATMIKRSKRPILVVGSKATELETRDGDLVDTAIRLFKTGRITVVATAHMIREFLERGVEGVHSMPLFTLGKKLGDLDWGGFDGGGPYDAVVFAGFPYYMEWLLESGLKNFSGGLRTISLDRSYQPNAQWSLGWMPKPEWLEALDSIVQSLEEEG